ncbi:ankyrin repeat-containing protein [Fusarium beomiforme]|uniref:Ankyrin repeat-containing protein n=1 Tax=Fusarium beomiforme TaxID=44412 RepID=A0A9P5AJB8_9HYPO|nr:ankyrin repeat-containing protein [Fusarium beomiforme]
MRLVNSNNIQLEFVNDDNAPDYAILSHTWEQEEVLFHDMGLESGKLKKGYPKLESCCRVARENGFAYIWDDTCCIDKTSSAELSEAINSMYRYYQEASICYVYLADVSEISQVSHSRWFTRGWTLQELIAPRQIIFFNKDWHQLGTKISLVDVLSQRTNIPASILCDSDELETTSVAQRMSWAADRVTTRKEDGAYSLMGIFGINMPLLYGEGDKAFYRLQEEIMRASDDHSLFAWKFPSTRGGLLAPTPAAFKFSGDIIPWNPFTPYNSPYTITNKGVHMEAPFIAQDVSGRGLCVLHCTRIGTRDKLIAVHLRDVYLTMEHFERCRTDEFEWVNLNTFNLTRYPVRSLCIRLHPPTITRTSRRNEGQTDTLPDASTAIDHKVVQLSLSEAASMGYAGTVWFLLAQTPSGAIHHEARSAICLAARSGHEQLVSQLMARRDTSTLTTDDHGRTALSHAAECGQEAIVRSILSSAKIHPDTKDSNGLTALWYAVYHRHSTCAKLLLQKGLVSGNVGGIADVKTALWHATSAGDVELVELLVQNRALEGPAGPALCTAVESGNLAIVEILLDNSVDTEERDAKRRTPLHIACRQDNHEMVVLLIKRGANPDRMDSSGKTELASATLRGNAALVKLLLENGANPRAKCANGKTAAAYAAGQEMKSLIGNQHWLHERFLVYDLDPYAELNRPPLNKAYFRNDPRYAPVVSFPRDGLAFSRNFLIYFRAAREHPFQKKFFLVHLNAGDCETGARCEHWRIMEIGPNTVNVIQHPETLCLQVVGVRNDFVAAGNSGFNGVQMFDRDEAHEQGMTDEPCFVFEAIKPDFSVIEQAGYTVVYWMLYDEIQHKCMDQYGRMF